MEGKCYIVPQQFEPRVIKQLFHVAPGGVLKRQEGVVRLFVKALALF